MDGKSCMRVVCLVEFGVWMLVDLPVFEAAVSNI